MIEGLYKLATALAAPWVWLALMARRLRGKEDRARIGERFGRPGRARPEGPLVWIHGASVGESLSALPLIERLLARNHALHVLVTTGTVSSAAMMAARLPGRAFHQFVPVDLPGPVRRFAAHWRPDLALVLESELWPNLLAANAKRGTPMVLLNGRMSTRSQARWRLVPGFARAVLGRFERCLAQSEADAARFSAIGAPAVSCPGNLKYAAAPLPGDDRALKALKKSIGARPIWLAASTHPGEEAVVAGAHPRLRDRHAGLLTILVPRHAGRGARLARELAAAGLSVARRAAAERIGPRTDIYLADTMGELGLFYRLAPIVLVGGSLVPHGGQNLLEPAQLDCALLHGFHIGNFRPIAEAMRAAGASETVADADALIEAVDRLLSDPPETRRRAAAAAKVAASEAGVLDRYLEALSPHLDALPRAGRASTKRQARARA